MFCRSIQKKRSEVNADKNTVTVLEAEEGSAREVSVDGRQVDHVSKFKLLEVFV